MAVPSSGELKLWDTLWNDELGGSQGENSLHSASVYAGFSTPDALSDFYGWSDVEIPSVSTNNANSIGTTSANVGGVVNQNGNETPQVGSYVGTSNSYTSNTKYTAGTSNSNFSQNITGLSQVTNYKNRAWACNSAGQAIGGQNNFTTNEQPYGVSFQVSRGISANGPGASSTSIAHYWVNPYSGGNNYVSGASGGTFATNGPRVPYSNNALNRFYANTNGNQLGVGIGAGAGGTFGVGGCFIRTSGGNISGYFCYTSDINLKTNITYL